MELQEKLDKLLFLLQSYDTVAVAYSGGPCSTFLLACAIMADDERVTAISAGLQGEEKACACSFCEESGIPHVLVDANGEGRSRLFASMEKACVLQHLGVLCEASAADTCFTPEKHVQSPLVQCGISTRDVQILSRQFGLPVYEETASSSLQMHTAAGISLLPEKAGRA